MKKNNITKLIFIGILGLLLAAGCSGKNGSTGAPGPTGAQGVLGSEGPANPTVSWVMPVQGATGVYTDSVIKVGFSKPMDPSTINASTFSVSTGGIPVTGSISYNSGSQTAFFNPNVPLYQFGFYSATLTTGIKDTTGSPLTASYVWMFLAGGSSTPSHLYAANWSGDSISVFNNASTINGNIAPDRTISGAATTLNSPFGFWYDSASDRFYVANSGANSVLVFNNASMINGNVAPSRTIVGIATTLSNPYGIWYDSASDRLFVANYGASSILVFNNASMITGNAPPDRTISGAATALDSPGSMWYDSASDRLYVANYGASSILVFNNASMITGNAPPDRTISGAATALNGPFSLWYDSTSDRLFVSNYVGDSILVFNNASAINGNAPPDRTISGAATTLNEPIDIRYDSSSDRLYVANYGASSILVFNNASTITGNVAPDRTISGAATTLDGPCGLWLDMNP